MTRGRFVNRPYDLIFYRSVSICRSKQIYTIDFFLMCDILTLRRGTFFHPNAF